MRALQFVWDAFEELARAILAGFWHERLRLVMRMTRE